jgi:radical SAM superfamily enzyme YgiQ (UPF0313 family)
MNQVLITHSYFLRFDPKQLATGQPYAPLGTLYAAAVLREKGFQVDFFDCMFAHSPQDIIPSLEKIKPGIFVIYDDGFNYLTKMCLTNMREAAVKMIAAAKALGWLVIISSSDSTDHFEYYLEQGADFVVLGEGEETLSTLVTALKNHDYKFHSIEGLAYKDNTNIIKTAKRPVMKDLDLLPQPAWDLLAIEPYRNTWIKQHGYFSMNMATTRGCPFKCNWCAKPIYGNRYHSRSPEKVVEELLLLKDKFGYDHIWFCDDIFGLKPGWIHRFANLIAEKQLQFTFKMQGRVDLLLEENNIYDLARAGCDSIWMGAESGSQKILDAMDKGTSLQQISNATVLLKKHNIKPCFFIQFGYPGETKADIKNTIDMIKQLLPYEMGISVSYPLPGTGFYEKVKEELKEKTNWTDSDELALLLKTLTQQLFISNCTGMSIKFTAFVGPLYILKIF